MTTQQPMNEPRQLLKIRQVMAVTCLARSTVYKYCSEHSFPKPIQIGSRSVAWVASEVQEWINQRVKVRDLAG